MGKAKPNEQLIRKLNIATLKLRPVCAYSGAKCGLRWYQIEDKSYSETVYLSGAVKGSNAEQQSVDKIVLDALKVDFNESN